MSLTAENFHSRADHAKYAPVGRLEGEHLLLDRAKGFGRGCVAGDHHEVASDREEFLNSLTGEIENELEAAGAIGSAGIVAEIDVIVLRQPAADFLEDGEASVTGVENSDRTRSG